MTLVSSHPVVKSGIPYDELAGNRCQVRFFIALITLFQEFFPILIHIGLEFINQLLVPALGEDVLEPALGLEPFGDGFFLLGGVIELVFAVFHFIKWPVTSIG